MVINQMTSSWSTMLWLKSTSRDRDSEIFQRRCEIIENPTFVEGTEILPKCVI